MLELKFLEQDCYELALTLLIITNIESVHLKEFRLFPSKHKIQTANAKEKKHQTKGICGDQ